MLVLLLKIKPYTIAFSTFQEDSSFKVFAACWEELD